MRSSLVRVSRQAYVAAAPRLRNNLKLSSKTIQKPKQHRKLSTSSTAPESTNKKNEPPPTMQNLALASALLGFCGFVFTYSLNAVGRSEGDPLAQLQEEAQEARSLHNNQQERKLSKAEIEALESGMTGGGGNRGSLEVAVAAPADIAQLEEEANMRAFRSKMGDDTEGDSSAKKKKPWWRFGF